MSNTPPISKPETSTEGRVFNRPASGAITPPAEVAGRLKTRPSLRIILFILLLIGSYLQAAPPANDGLFPCGAKAGTTIEASLSGKASPWPPNFWCSNPKVSFTPGEKSPRVSITIAADAKPGPCLIRTFNAEGCSEPFTFLIDKSTQRTVLEDESKPNRGPNEGQPVTEELPCVIYGRLNPTKDVDCYLLELKQDQTLHAFVEAYTFLTGLDCLLHLYSPKGERIALTHDNVITPDPELTYPIPETGRYTLAIMGFATPPSANVHFHGGTKCSYRINLSTKPSNIPARLKPSVPAIDPKQPGELVPPFSFFKTLNKTGAPDVYTFKTEAKTQYSIEAKAYDYRFPTDPVLSIFRPDGRLIKEIDDAKGKTRDAAYVWTSATADNYSIQVKDRYGNGGSPYHYQLTVKPTAPRFSATVEKSNYIIEAGKELSIKLKLERLHGHKAPLSLSIKNLPEQVTFEPPTIPTKSGDITIKLTCPADAKPFSGAIEISLKETEGPPKTCPYSFQDKNARGPYLINELSTVWLTIKTAGEKKE